MSGAAQDLGSEKLQNIRDAALDAFLRYGFKRTTMEDIAAGANMSRAALYLHFKNKRDIFRSVAEGLYLQAGARFEAALDPAKPVATTLTAALEAKDGGLMARVLASPHAADIMGMGAEAAVDLSEAGEARSVEILTDYFNAVLAARGAEAQTPPGVLARHIVDCAMALSKKPDDGTGFTLLGRTGAALLGVD